MWRKNRRLNSGGTYGVDLNRNYPIGWNFSCAGSTTPGSEEYRGPSAASEPEVQNLIRLHQIFKFAKLLDLHSYAREVRQIYADCASLPASVDAYLGDIAEKLAGASDYTNARSCCMGGHPAYSYNSHGGLSYLVETGTAFQPPAAQMQAEVVRVWPMALTYLEFPIPLFGHVVDQDSGVPVEARVVVNGLSFNYNENFSSSLPFGRYHLWLPPGRWTLSFVASGYLNATTEVTSPSLTNIDVKLVNLHPN